MTQERASIGSISHVVITRFNLPSEGYETLIRAKDGWLRSRVDLFERYCLPSMRHQRGADAAWIIYFDPESPAWLREWIDRVNRDDFLPVYRATVSHDEMLADIRKAVGEVGEHLITTNLDNDDALAVDFLARVQAAAQKGVRTAIYLADGLIVAGDSAYHRVDKHNAFCSVAEPWGTGDAEPVTCWVRSHDALGEVMPVRSIRGSAAWLQVIHGTNVSNRVRGRLVSPASDRARFGALLDGLPEPRAALVLRDRVVFGPLRAIREGGRAVAKRVTIALLGRAGIDALKVRVARLRRLGRTVSPLDRQQAG
jgi:hypothetical protein